MSAQESSSDVGIRQWHEKFLASPFSTLDDLLRGQASVAPYYRAEPVELARLLFSPSNESQVLIDTLDQALVVWFRLAKEEKIPIDPYERDWLARAASNGFGIAAALELDEISIYLRTNLEVLSNWTAAVTCGVGADARANLLAAVALTQTIAAQSDQVARLGLEPYWLNICEMAGSSLPQHYLSIALLGLRMLPERAGQPSERPWMSGLAKWVAIQQPSTEVFAETWNHLRSQYPRINRFWKRAVTATLDQKIGEKIPERIRQYWTDAVELGHEDTDRKPPWVSFDITARQVDDLVKDAGRPIAQLRTRIESLLASRAYYAEATGDAFPLSITITRIGGALLEKSSPEALVERANYVAQMSREGLRWQPNNFWLWAQWRDALFEAGRVMAGENVGWEGIRRFPEDRMFYSQLAKAISRIPKRQAVAEALLRETFEKFPDDAVSGTQLAALLTRFPNRHIEAEQLYHEVIRRFPADPYPRSQLAELLVANKRIDEAEKVIRDAERNVDDKKTFFDLRARIAYSKQDLKKSEGILREGMRLYPHDHVLRNHLADLEKGESLVQRSLAYGIWPEFDDKYADAPTATLDAGSGGRLRRIWSQLVWTAKLAEEEKIAIQKELQEIISEDPYLPFAQFVSAALNEQKSSGPTVFEVAFAQAVLRKDVETLVALDVPVGKEVLMDLAKVALLKDGAAAGRIGTWLINPSAPSRLETALREIVLRRLNLPPVNEEPSFGEELLKRVAANDAVRFDLIDLVFIPSLSMAA
jgi:hypothetical protein